MTDEVTRFEVIDNRKCQSCDGERIVHDGRSLSVCKECQGTGTMGRVMSVYGTSVELSLQDGGRTLKVFLDD